MGTKMKSFSKRSTFFVQFFTLACFFSAGLKRKQYYVILCIIKHSFRSMSTLYQISFVKVNILPKHSLTKVQLSVFYIFKLLINTILQIFQRDRKIWNERGKKPYILLTIYVRNVGREKFDKIWQNTKLYQHWQNNNPLPRPPSPLPLSSYVLSTMSASSPHRPCLWVRRLKKKELKMCVLCLSLSLKTSRNRYLEHNNKFRILEQQNNPPHPPKLKQEMTKIRNELHL